MRKIWIIARREYLYNFRKKSFLFSAFGVPIMVIAIWIVSFALAEQQATATGNLGNIGYVDLAGLIKPEVEAPEEFIAYASVESADAAFRAKEIGAYFVITGSYWNDGMVETYSSQMLPEGIEDQIEEYLHANVLTYVQTGHVERLAEPLNFDLRVVGSPVSFTEDSVLALFLLPMAFAFVFMLATTVTSQFLMQGVSEEKESRVMEILVTSSTPEQMLAGKVLGLGALGLTQVLVYGAVAAVIVLVSDPNSPVAQLLRLPPLLLALILAYFTLGYLFYGAIFAGVGAAVTGEQEGRQFAGIFSLLVVLPLIFSFTFFQDPNGPIPVALSLIPFTAPMGMLFRLPLASIPAWQFVASLALMAAATALAVWVAARVFRLGMLMYGKRLSLRDLMRLRPGAGATAIRTMAAGEEAKRGV